MADWLLAQQGIFIYAGLALALLAGAVGLPIPEDVPLIIGGVLIASHRADAQLLLPIAYMAVVAGDLFIFWIGRGLNRAASKRGWFSSEVTSDRLEAVKRSLERSSLLKIFVARHIFYLRTATFLACGALKMSWRKFILADCLAALISVPLMSALGYYGAKHSAVIFSGVHLFKTLSVVAGLFFLGACLWWRHQSRRVRLVQSPPREAGDQ